MRIRVAAALALSLALPMGGTATAQSVQTAAQSVRTAQPGVYDYYVLALTWAPTFCAQGGSASNPRTCAPEFGDGFVLHGLWPEHDTGGWPENCPTQEWVTPVLAGAFTDLMPDTGQIDHQWRKHGSCTGMEPDLFFAETRAAWERVSFPPDLTPDAAYEDIRPKFLEANQLFDLRAEDMAVVCEKGLVREVRICMDKDLNFRACGKGVVDTCRPGDRISSARK